MIYASQKPNNFKALCASYEITGNKTFLRLAHRHLATLAPTEWPPFRSPIGEGDL